MPAWWWAAAAALIVATASVVWLARDRSAPAPAIAVGPAPGVTATPPIASTPPAATGQPRVTPAPVVLATITLFGPVVRDAAQIPVLSIPAGQGLVRVEVALQDGDVFPTYRAEITTQSGAAVFSAGRLPPSTSASGRTVVTELAADRLPNGTYLVTVYGVRADLAITLVTYSFRVTR